MKKLRRASLAVLVSLLASLATAQEVEWAGFQPVVANPHKGAVPEARAVRIVSFNVHYAREPLELADALRASDAVAEADVFLIQEIEAHDHEPASRAAQLASALNLNYVYAPARATHPGCTHGLAILSRYPLRDVEVIPLPQFDLRFNTHRRIALAATLDVGRAPVRFYNLHLDTRLNPADRQEQLRPVVERARADAVSRVVIGGDFNTVPIRWLGRVFPIFYSDQGEAVDEVMRQEGFETKLNGAGATLRRSFLRFRLDTIYTRGLAVRASGSADDVEGSDHRPVWIEVAWP
ncbi:MAG: endonuclease/exonuclease/phosphatase family protein [Acidobacteria bacterium]|nr:endonuclease/exonuclease/phosphatase family protein [Acidobacteriota bacterium]